MTIRTRLRLVILLAGVIATAAVTAVLVQKHRTEEDAARMAEVDTALRRTLLLTHTTLEYLTHPSTRVVTQWRAGHKEIGKRLQEFVPDTGGEAAAVKSLTDDLAHSLALFDRLEAFSSATSKKIGREILAGQLMLRMQSLASGWQRLETALHQRTTDVQELSSLLVVVLMGTLMTIVVVGSLLLGRSIIGPLDALRKAMARVGAGSLEYRAAPEARDEIGQLDMAFGGMVNELKQARDLREGIEAERKRLETARRDAEQRFQAAFNSIEEAMLIASPDRLMVVINPAAERMFGYTQEEARNQSTELFHVDHEHYVEFGVRIHAAFARNETANFEFRMKRKNGEIFPSEHTVSVLRNDAGAVVGIVSVARDITERKRAEAEMRWLNQELQAHAHGLNERVKELKALYAITQITAHEHIPLERIFRQVAEILPAAYQFSDIARARIVFEGQTHALQNFAPCAAHQTADIMLEGRQIGSVQVCYCDARPAAFEGPFLKEERDLINAVAKRLAECVASRRTAEQIRASHDLFRSVVENAPVRLFWKDSKSCYLGGNTAFARDAGLTRPEDLLGKDDYQLAWRAQAELYRADDKQVMESGSPKLGFEEPQTTADGRLVWLRTSKVPLRDDAGKITGILGIYEDITAQRKVAQDLQESERKYRELVQDANSIILRWKPDGRILFMNEFGERFFDYSEDALRGRHVVGTIVPEVESTGRDLKQLMASICADPKQFEHNVNENMRRSGERVWIRWTNRFFTDERGQITEILSVGSDITDARRAEESLRHSEEGLKQAQRMARLGSWKLDLVANKLTWSDEIYHVFEIDPAKFGASYEAFLDMIHPDDRELVNRAYTESVRNRTPYDIVHRLLMKDGRIKYVNERGETIYDESGKPLRSQGTVQDVTERRLAELELRRLNWALQALSRSNAALVHGEAEQEIFQACCEGITSADGYDLAWVGLAENSPEKTVRVVAAAGRALPYLEGIHITWADEPHGHGPTGTVIRSGVTQVNNDFATNPLFAPWLAKAQAHGLASSIALPIRSEGKIIGALTVYGRETQSFNAPEIKLFEELADNVGFGLSSRHARQELDAAMIAQQRSAAKLRESLEGTIRAVALTVEKRDPYTAGHQNKVAELCVAIGRKLGLSEERLEGLRLGATIHDIGKVYVPAEILNRPGRLTPAEFEIIKSHPEVGYDIIKDVQFPWPVGQMILQHHERLDGTGYPKGLKGEEIILEARILAVADVVEAMSSHRPYRAAVGPEKALAEIEQHRGTRYDTTVADACLRLFREKRFSLSG